MSFSIWYTLGVIFLGIVALVMIHSITKTSLRTAYLEILTPACWQLSPNIRKKVEEKTNRKISIGTNIEILHDMEEEGLVEGRQSNKRSSDVPGSLYIWEYRLIRQGKRIRNELTV